MIETFTFDWHLVALSLREAGLVSPSMTLQYRQHVLSLQAKDELVHYFTARALEKSEPDGELETDRIKIPSDWWSAFKLRWYPKWALVRWPAKEREIKIVTRFRRVRICPHLEVPNGGATVKIRIVRHIDWLNGAETP